MRNLKINITVEDPTTKEILIVTGDLEILRELVSGVRLILPQYVEADTPNLQEFITDYKIKIDMNNQKFRTQSQDLYNLYVQWCEKNDYLALSSTRLAREWKKLGFNKQKINGLAYWVGIKL